MNLRGKSILITGASRGFGRALAFELGRRGARLALVARDKRSLDAVAAELREKDVDAHAIPADVAGPGAATAIAARATAAIGELDIVVHNASDLGPVPLQLLLDTSDEDFERAFAVNVVAPFQLSRAIVGPMVLRGSGLVVHVTSDAATSAYPNWGAYGASKAALDHLSRIWGAELAERGVKFMAFDPGEMDTKMHQDAIPDADPATLAKPEDVAKKLAGILAEA